MDSRAYPPTALLFFATTAIAAGARTYFGPTDPLLTTTLVAAVAAFTFWWVLEPRRPGRPHLLIVATAFVAIHAAIVVTDAGHPGHHPLNSWLGDDRQQAEVVLEIVDGPHFYDEALRYDARLLAIDIDDGTLTTPAPMVRIYYRTGDLPRCSPLPLPGDQISAWAQIQRFAQATSQFGPSPRALREAQGLAAFLEVGEPFQFPDFGPDGPENRQNFSLYERLKRRLTLQRLALEYNLADHLDGGSLAMATAMITGSRGGLTPELREPFDITSTGHILAISGLHFAVIAALIAALIRLVLDRFPKLYERWPRRVILGVFTLGVLTIYLLAIGAPISARRAFGMTALAIVALCFSPWRLRPLSALAATAAALLLWNPLLMGHAGYQLSVAATAAILAFMRFRPAALRPPPGPWAKEESPWRRRRRRLLIFGGISLSATIATAPIVLSMSGELPIAGLWLNLVVIPLVGSVIFPLLVIGALLTDIWSGAAALILGIAGQGLDWLHWAVDHIAYWPGSVYRWGNPSRLELLGLAMAALTSIVGGLRPKALVLAMACVATVAAPGAIAKNFQPTTTTIHFLDVGQGDATIIEFFDDTTVLVDGGGRPLGADPGLTRVVPYLRHLGIDRLDALILTHGDYDHYGGLFAVIRPFRPRKFIVDGAEQKEAIDDLRRQISDNGGQIIEIEESTTRPARLPLTLYRPELPQASDNDRSLIVDFSVANAGVLLPGDIEVAGEQWLQDRISTPRAILKVPHHGSRTSSTPSFLDHLKPALAINSSGRHNRFGHPHPDILSRYAERAIDVYRIDKRGSIVVEIDQHGVIEVRH